VSGGAQGGALQKRRDLGLRLGVVAGKKSVQGRVVSEDVAEDRVQRLHDGCALGGGNGDLLAAELPGVVASPLASELEGLDMSTRILPASASP